MYLCLDDEGNMIIDKKNFLEWIIRYKKISGNFHDTPWERDEDFKSPR